MLAVCAGAAPPTQAFLRAVLGPQGDSIEAKQTNVRQQQRDMLGLFYESNPELKAKVGRAAGYATFSILDLNLFVVATGGGYGVLMDNRTGRETFMRVASLGGGLGVGAKDLRVLFIFNNAEIMRQFVDQGWQFGGQADAAAKVNEKGVGAGATAGVNIDPETGAAAAGGTLELSANVGDTREKQKTATPGGMEIYQHTKHGVALQATVAGTKYWKDSELNP